MKKKFGVSSWWMAFIIAAYAPSVMDLSHLGNGEKNLGEAKGPRRPSERARASQS